MQGNTFRIRKAKGRTSGWLAFVLGMAGMFVVMALWVALVEMGKDPHADAELIGRPQSAEDGLSSGDAPTSDRR